MARVTFYPIGNTDCCLIRLDNDKSFVFDNSDMHNPDDLEDKRMPLKEAFDEGIGWPRRNYVDVLAFTHGDDKILQCKLRRALRCLILVGYLCTSVAWAGMIDEVSRSVVFLNQNVPVVEQVNGTRFEVWLKFPDTNAFVPKQTRNSGSGFIVASSNICYLITAKHVATNMTEDSEVVMRGEKMEPLRFRMSSITGQPAIRWFHHKDADISIHPLPTITPEGAVALDRRGMPLEFLEAQTNLPHRDTYVTALGFPFGLGAEGEFIPLSRDSKVSSGILNDGAGLFFLLQDPSVSGYSGGPLVQSGDPRVIATDPTFAGIKVVSGGARCWGFVSGTYADETGGKMTRVTPAFYALELIRQAQRELIIVQAPFPSSEKK